MGDIRIGGYNFGSSTLASAYMPPPANTYSIAGDIQFNTGQVWAVGGTYDLFTVAMHEIGHALGMLHSSLTTAVMYSNYTAAKSGLNSDDISGIRAIYGTRQQDAYDANGSNGTASTADDLSSLISPTSLTAVVNNLDITTTSDVDYYTFTAPSGTSSTLTVTAQSQGLSLLTPSLTVYAADGTTGLGSATANSNQYGATLTVTINGVTAGQRYYVKVAGANTTAFGTGAYGLTLYFGTGSSPTVTSSSMQTMNTGAPTASGGQANDTLLPNNAGTQTLINTANTTTSVTTGVTSALSANMVPGDTAGSSSATPASAPRNLRHGAGCTCPYCTGGYAPAVIATTQPDIVVRTAEAARLTEGTPLKSPNLGLGLVQEGLALIGPDVQSPTGPSLGGLPSTPAFGTPPLPSTSIPAAPSSGAVDQEPQREETLSYSSAEYSGIQDLAPGALFVDGGMEFVGGAGPGVGPSAVQGPEAKGATPTAILSSDGDDARADLPRLLARGDELPATAGLWAGACDACFSDTGPAEPQEQTEPAQQLAAGAGLAVLLGGLWRGQGNARGRRQQEETRRSQAERRRATRYPCFLDVFCRPVGAAATERWPAEAWDLSTGGVRIHLHEPSLPGSLLILEVGSAGQGPWRLLLARVKHAVEQAPGEWHVGCTFERALGNDEVQTLLLGRPGTLACLGDLRPPSAVELVC